MDEFPLLWNHEKYREKLTEEFGSIRAAAHTLGLSRSTLYEASRWDTMPSRVVRAAIARWRGVAERDIWPDAPPDSKSDLEEVVYSVATSAEWDIISESCRSAAGNIQLSAIADSSQELHLQNILSVFEAYLEHGVDCSVVFGTRNGQVTKELTRSREQLRERCNQLRRQFPNDARSGKGVFRFAEIDPNLLSVQLHLAIDRRVYYEVVPGVTQSFRTLRKKPGKRR